MKPVPSAWVACVCIVCGAVMAAVTHNDSWAWLCAAGALFLF